MSFFPVLCGALTGLFAVLLPTASADQPNVLMICVDDMNDWCGCLAGHPQARTPNIDQLAANGMLFTNAHTPATTCNPARTAVLTGLRPSTTGVYANGHWWRPALPDVVTLPEHFKRNGYHVAGGGKVFHWHSRLGGFNPPDQWDDYFPIIYDEPAHRADPDAAEFTALAWPPGFPLNGLEAVRKGRHPPMGPMQFDWGPVNRTDQEMGDGRMVAWTIEQLNKQHKKPFFLVAGIFRPHLPWYAPKKYFEQHPLPEIELPPIKEKDLEDVPKPGRRLALARSDEFELIVNTGQYRAAVQAYLASISFVDSLVGQLLVALADSSYADNTIVVFWSDHGWHLGEKRHWHKSTLWERSTHVPLLFSGADLPQGVRCDSPVSLLDIYPTLIDLCRLPPAKLDGESLRPLLEDPNSRAERAVVSTSGRGNHSVRSQHWRYTRYADGSEELYDHRNDPNEWTNLAKDAQYVAVKQQLEHFLPKKNAPPAPGFAAYEFNRERYEWKRK